MAAAVIELFFEWSKAIGQCRLLSSLPCIVYYKYQRDECVIVYTQKHGRDIWRVISAVFFSCCCFLDLGTHFLLCVGSDDTNKRTRTSLEQPKKTTIRWPYINPWHLQDTVSVSLISIRNCANSISTFVNIEKQKNRK